MWIKLLRLPASPPGVAQSHRQVPRGRDVFQLGSEL
jgi:hypothetical protein